MTDSKRQLEYFKTVTHMGSLMLSNGGEIFRINAAMNHGAKSLGLNDFNAYVIANAIFASITIDGELYSTRICYVPLASTNLCRVEALNELSRKLASKNFKYEDIKDELKHIENLESSSKLTKVVCSGLGSGSFCYLFGGSFYDTFVSFIAGVVLYFFLLYIVPKLSIPKIMSYIAGSALVTLLCHILYSLGIGNYLDKIIIGAIFPLVPGIPITNAIRNFLENDHVSGLIRMVDALITATCIAAGVGVALRIWIIIGGLI